MPPSYDNHRIALQRVFQSMGFKITRVKADVDQPYATPLPLDQGICGQSGGE